MSYYKVKSVDTRNEDNMYITFAANNLVPLHYERVKFEGDYKDLLKALLSGALQILKGNRQKVHDAFLQALIYLKNNNVDTYELYKKDYDDEYFDKALQIFKQVLNSKSNKKMYYVTIEGRNFLGWHEHGYNYSLIGHKPVSFTDVLLAQLKYNDMSYIEA